MPAGGADGMDDDPAGAEGEASWEGIGGWDPPPRSWMGDAVVEDDSRADVDRRRLSAVEGSERTRGRGAKVKDDMVVAVLCSG